MYLVHVDVIDTFLEKEGRPISAEAIAVDQMTQKRQSSTPLVITMVMTIVMTMVMTMREGRPKIRKLN